MGLGGLISGERSVLRLVPERLGAIVVLTNCASGRSLYRSLVPELMDAWFDVPVPALAIEPRDGSPATLRATQASRRGRTAAGRSRRPATRCCSHRDRVLRALPIDARTFLVEASDPDVPTVTFDVFDSDGRPNVLYKLLWGFPRSR